MGNRLATAASLYLRQHGEDPVDWWPWSEEALHTAERSGRPILLSIGYSACHWCHVMAHESFADPAVAELINANFVAIKVDREERPDLDRNYQLAHQALNRRAGGWPLTAFLDPLLRLPFFIGTYFPPNAAHGLPAFSDLLSKLATWYGEHRKDWSVEVRGLADFLQQHGVDPAEQGPLHRGPIDAAAAGLLAAVDWQHGGRQGAPKFPAHSELAWGLGRLPRWQRDASTDPLDALPIDVLAQQSALNALLRGEQREGGAPEHALFSMARIVDSGLQDHIGGGFFRYCADADWNLPHFEKMLYDNAQWLSNLAEAQQVVPSKLWRDAALGVVRWLQEEMSLPEGGFASALDADSEGGEGASYVWTQQEWRACLGGDAGWMAEIYGLDRDANAGNEHWHLRRRLGEQGLSELAARLQLDESQLRKRMEQLKRGLRLQRGQRPAPQRDEKCLTAANGLLLRGLVQAARAFDRSDWLELAVELCDQVSRRVRDGSRLRALDYPQQRGGPGFLDDYAALLLGLIELLQARFQPLLLEWAIELAESLLRDFEHLEVGGFWFSAHDQVETVHRGKPVFDDAAPAGNALAARGLQQLGSLLAEPRYIRAAERSLRSAWSSLSQAPDGCCSMLQVLQAHLRPPPVLIARLANVSEHQRWHRALQQAEQQRFDVYRLPAADSLLPTALESKRWLSGGRVYWCEGVRCLPRFDNPVALLSAMDRFAENASG
ncbi:thioredoxin domain-containing protein [Pseudomarimonas arenosa]|uniref:Thioredoxin domain-containing protein n=1 Tax=Pseudomarimonas arenosa TaxID=2774145 RepID=A0AAW3ZM24_9GAMM|nr:thioredoxin domain-containing protein [Pseudomarimonas arenosa]MBD8526594.1 thioredoxin domain-containing protein [Pseudomarimonas arenosa]